METKYNVGDKVLISAKVVEITVTDEKIEYLLKYKDNGSHATYYSKQLEDDIRGIDPTPDEEEDTPIVPDDPALDEPVILDEPTPGDDINPDDTGTTDDTGSDSTTATDGNEQNNG